MPFTSATAICDARYGSSLKVSKARPQRGSRMMLTVGPRSTFAPLPANSAPIAEPYCCSSAVSKVAASVIGAGIWVTPPIPSPTPAGPSCKPIAGMHSAGIAAVSPMYGEDAPVPCSIVIFWASVIWASSCETRVAIGAVEFTHGQLPGAGLGDAETGGGALASPTVATENSHSEYPYAVARAVPYMRMKRPDPLTLRVWIPPVPVVVE